MGLENEPSSIEATLEQFKEDLSDAAELAKEFEARTPLQNLSSFDELKGHEEEMVESLFAHFEFNPSQPQVVVKEYSMPGTPNSPGEGEIKVRVLATNDPEVFLGEYKYADGDIVWAIRPLDVEE